MESSDEFSAKKHIIHYWKDVNLKEKTMQLDEESDAYRKSINDSLIQQLNISSKIISDSNSVRKGLLFYISKNNTQPRNEKKLNEEQIDSVAIAWGLNQLARK